MPATYKDIQRLTGFSLSTISRYFNGERVKPATQKAIKEAADRLDFKMNDFARGLKSRKAMTIGLLIHNLNGILSTTIMSHITRLLRQHGYGCLICDCNSDKEVEIDAMNFFIRKSVDGVITIPIDTNPVQLESARRRNIPIVLIDRTIPSFETDAVIIDNFDAGKMASEYLISKGHKRAAIIAGYSNSQTMTDREKGFLSLYEKSGFAFSARMIETNYTIDDSYRAVKELLTDPGEITALFCTSYVHTLGTVIAMNEIGIRFPNDISLIGFDNMLQLAEAIRPSITIIEQPLEQIAHRAVELLLRRLEKGASHPYETVMLKAELVEGASVADLR